MRAITKPFTEGRKSIFLFLISLCAFIYVSILTIAPYGLQADFLLSHDLTVFQFKEIWTGYFFGYVAGLILCGVIIDIIGESWALMVGMALAVIGNLLFTYNPNFQVLLQARTLIGFDYGLISIAILKQLNDTFTARHFSFGLAIIAVCSVAVTLVSQNFLDVIVYDIPWKSYLNGLSLIGGGVFVLALLPLLFWGRNIPCKVISLTEIIALVKQPAFWLGSVGVYIAWQYIFFLMSHVSVPYLAEHLQFSSTQITFIVSIALGLFAVSALVLGYFSEAITRKRIFILAGFLLMVSALVIFIDDKATAVWWVGLAMAIGAIGASVIVLIYARLREYCTPASVGFAFGLVLLIYTMIQLIVSSYLFQLLAKIQMATTHGLAIEKGAQYSDLLGLLALMLLVGACLLLGVRSHKDKVQTTDTLGQELKQCWHGQAGLGRTFWCLFVMGSFYMSVALWTLMLLLVPSEVQAEFSKFLWSLLLIPYQAFALICLWRCAFNTQRNPLWSYAARAVVLVSVLQIGLQIGLCVYWVLS